MYYIRTFLSIFDTNIGFKNQSADLLSIFKQDLHFFRYFVL